jgi:hypothetical protein
VTLHEPFWLRDQDAGDDTLLVDVESTTPRMNNLQELAG